MKVLTDKNIFELVDFIINYGNDKSYQGYHLVLNKLLEYSIPFSCSTLSKGANLFRARVHQENEDYFNIRFQ